MANIRGKIEKAGIDYSNIYIDENIYKLNFTLKMISY